MNMSSGTRREFLSGMAGIAAGAAIFGATGRTMAHRADDQPSSKPDPDDAGKPGKLRILMLGGTGFLGPHVVWHAQKRGHEITLFNRGKTAPGLFDDLEHIEGDRYGELGNLSEAVKGGRRWDCAIDTFAYVPSVVTSMMEALGKSIDHYALISTVSVYADNDVPNADEDAPLAEVADDVAAGIKTHREVGEHYGAMKARCEKAAEEAMPGRVANIRPGLIVGPRDTSGRYTYWPVRASEGGTMIGPGDGKDHVQIIDVRDLAEFIVLAAEKRLGGAYNAISPAGKFTIGDVVNTSVSVTGGKSKVEWIDAEFLEAQGVQAWQEMPCWVPPSAPGYAAIGNRSCERAIRAGLKCRPLDETTRATLAYYNERGAELKAERGEEFIAGWRKQIRGGLAPDKEAKVLEAWKARG